MKNKLFRVLCALLVLPIVFVSSVSAASSARSDTTGNFTIPQGKTYTFKITSSSRPTLAAGSKSFRYVSSTKSGDHYFIKFSAIGKAGDGCGFYLGGGKRPVAIARILADIFHSDTTGNFTVPQGETYAFKITSSSKPSLAAGSKSFQYVSTKQSGSNYFIKFSAVGKPGDGCGFYLNGSKRPVAIATINSASANGIGYTNSEVRFSLTLPASWAGQYRIISSATSVSFLHRESEQDGSKTGVLFSVTRYDGKLAAKDVAGAGKRYLVAQTNKYSYVLAYPSDVEYTATSKAGYQKLAADIDKISKTVFPTINTANPTYDAVRGIDEDGLTDNHIYTFANGSVEAAPGDYLLMLNGEFSDAHVIVRNDCALVPVSVIQQECGVDVLWGYLAGNGDISPYGSDNGSSNMPLIIKIHNEDGSIDIKMTVGQTKADVNGKTEVLDTPPVIENNTAYVPLRFVCDRFGKATGYLPAGSDVSSPNTPKGLAFNPIVWVDDSEKTNAAKPTDATLAWLKAQMNQALTSLKKYRSAILEDTAPNDPAFSQIAHDINNTYYVGNVGRYSLYQGPYITLVDVNSKTIYFYTLHADSGYIQQANMSDPETFMLHYFAE